MFPSGVFTRNAPQRLLFVSNGKKLLDSHSLGSLFSTWRDRSGGLSVYVVVVFAYLIGGCIGGQKKTELEPVCPKENIVVADQPVYVRDHLTRPDSAVSKLIQNMPVD